MNPIRKALYPHRHNHDGSFDSICRRCFATVGHTMNEATLVELEKIHYCDPCLLAGREVLLSRIPRVGISLVPSPLRTSASATANGTSGLMQKPDM